MDRCLTDKPRWSFHSDDYVTMINVNIHRSRLSFVNMTRFHGNGINRRFSNCRTGARAVRHVERVRDVTCRDVLWFILKSPFRSLTDEMKWVNQICSVWCDCVSSLCFLTGQCFICFTQITMIWNFIQWYWKYSDRLIQEGHCVINEYN